MIFCDNHELYNEIAPNGYRIRGYFINEVIVIERMMDRFIAKHFTIDPDKQMELIELFISTKRIAFEGKRQAFKYIVDRYYHNKFTNKDLMYADLKKIEDLRNTLAHNILDTRQEAIEDIKKGTISFLKFENDSKFHSYTKDDIENFKKIIISLQTQIYGAI